MGYSEAPEIFCLHKGGRDARRALAYQSQAPREFFYGIIELQAQGYKILELNGAEPYLGMGSLWRRSFELAGSHLTGLGLRRHWVKENSKQMAQTKVVMSYTDGMSLSLGNYFSSIQMKSPFLAGCFHGLSDIESRAPRYLSKYVHKVIQRAVQRLDLVSFLGPADRDYAIDRYQIDPARCHHFRFGIDESFWSPGGGPTEEIRRFVAVGSDPNRDYGTLLKAPTNVPIVILTRLPLKIPKNRNVTLLQGSFWEGNVSDLKVRDLYRESMGVVVPLKDVYQPTGQSVTLQAMACGKPVVLTRNRGLWAPDLLRNEENCLLVPPADPGALARALDRLARDSQLRKKLGENALKTVLSHWRLDTTIQSSREIFDRGLAARAAT